MRKTVQCESCGLRFIQSQLGVIAWETTPQIALRNCSKKVREESGYIGGFFFFLWEKTWKHPKIIANLKEGDEIV